MALDVDGLYRKYGPMVLRRCRRLLIDEEQSMDAAQETFVPLFGTLAVEAGFVARVLIPSLSSSVPGADTSATIVRPSFILGLHI